MKRTISTGYATTLALVSVLFMSGCQQQPSRDDEPLPVKVPDPVVDMAEYSLPDTMGALPLLGDAQREHGAGRLFLYQSSGRDDEARVVIYPMAGGWDDIDPERAVAGQYGVVRQEAVARLLRQGFETVDGFGEGLFRSDKVNYPLAGVLLRARHQPERPVHIILLGASPPVFVRIERKVPADQAQALAVETQQWLEDVLQKLDDNNQASSSGNPANASIVETITAAATCSGRCP